MHLKAVNKNTFQSFSETKHLYLSSFFFFFQFGSYIISHTEMIHHINIDTNYKIVKVAKGRINAVEVIS